MFLIYVPGASSEDRSDILVSAGLSGLLSSVDFPSPAPAIRDVATGPAEKRGVVVGYYENAAAALRVGYFADRQEWTKTEIAGATSEVWLGRETGAKCSPLALRRRTNFPSVEVLLDDGQGWELPIVKDLPRENRYLQGEWVGLIREAYRQHFDMGRKVYAKMSAACYGQAGPPLTVAECCGFVVHGLAMNYCLTPEIVDYLGLLRSEDTMTRAAGESIEHPVMLEWEAQKKTVAQPALSASA